MLNQKWSRFWMRYSGFDTLGRMSTRIATIGAPIFKDRCILSRYSKKGYISPKASISHNNLILGDHVYIGDHVIIYQLNSSEAVIEREVQLYHDSIIETGEGGMLRIGQETHIQPRCQFSVYKGSLVIGKRVEIAPNCAFYPYDHEMAPGKRIRNQPLITKGGVWIGDDAWLGVGVIVLDGASVGNGAVIGAGSVVKGVIPDNAIACGVPARVIGERGDLDRHKEARV